MPGMPGRVGLEMPPNENPADWMSAPKDDLKERHPRIDHVAQYPHKE